MRDEEGGSIPAPRSNEIYKTAETKAEIVKEKETPKVVKEPEPKKVGTKTRLPNGTYGSVDELEAAAKAGKHAPGSTLIFHDVEGEKEFFKQVGYNERDFHGPIEYRVYVSRAISADEPKYMAIRVGLEDSIVPASQGRGSLNWSLK